MSAAVASVCGVTSGCSTDQALSLPVLLSSVFQVVATGPAAFRPPTSSRPSGVTAAAAPARASGSLSTSDVVQSPMAPVMAFGLSTKTVSVGALAASVPPMT